MPAPISTSARPRAGIGFGFSGTVSAGTVTLTTDLSTVYGTISLTVLNGATCAFAGDQHFKDVTLSGSGSISVGTPG